MSRLPCALVPRASPVGSSPLQNILRTALHSVLGRKVRLDNLHTVCARVYRCCLASAVLAPRLRCARAVPTTRPFRACAASECACAAFFFFTFVLRLRCACAEPALRLCRAFLSPLALLDRAGSAPVSCACSPLVPRVLRDWLSTPTTTYLSSAFLFVLQSLVKPQLLKTFCSSCRGSVRFALRLSLLRA